MILSKHNTSFETGVKYMILLYIFCPKLVMDSFEI